MKDSGIKKKEMWVFVTLLFAYLDDCFALIMIKIVLQREML